MNSSIGASIFFICLKIMVYSCLVRSYPVDFLEGFRLESIDCLNFSIF